MNQLPYGETHQERWNIRFATVEILKLYLQSKHITFSPSDARSALLKKITDSIGPRPTYHFNVLLDQADNVVDINIDEEFTTPPATEAKDTDKPAFPTPSSVSHKDLNDLRGEIDNSIGLLNTKLESGLQRLMDTVKALQSTNPDSTSGSVRPPKEPVSAIVDSQPQSSVVPPPQYILSSNFTTMLNAIHAYDNSKPELFPSWIKQYNSVTSALDWMDSDKTKGLQMVLKGKALDIYLMLKLNETNNQTTLSFAAVGQLLQTHYIPAGQTQYYVDKFFTRTMLKDEAVQDFHSDLNKIAIFAFPKKGNDFIEEVVKNRFVSALPVDIKRHLGNYEQLSLKDTVIKARQEESLQLSCKPVRKMVHEVVNVALHQPPHRSKPFQNHKLNNNNKSQLRCKICRMNNHDTLRCFFNPEGPNYRGNRSFPSNHSTQRGYDKKPQEKTKPDNWPAKQCHCFHGTDVAQLRSQTEMDPETSEQKHFWTSTDDSSEPAYVLSATKKPDLLRRCNVVGSIEGHSQTFLIDSGATITMCDYDFFMSFKTQDMKIHETSLTVYSLTDHEIDIVGATPLVIGLADKKVGHCVYLIRNGPAKVILGCDFLSRHKIDLLFSRNVVQLENHIVPMETAVGSSKFVHRVAAISQTITIPPHTTRMATIRLSNHSSGSVVIEERNFATNEANEATAYTERSICSTRNGQCKVPVFNSTDKYLTVPGGSPLAEVETIDSQTVVTMDDLANRLRRGIKIINRRQERKSHAKALATSERPSVTLIDLIGTLKLDTQLKHLTIDQRNKLVHVLTRYLDVFAMDDKNLGCTNVIEHEINTGDNAPIAQRPRRLPFQHREFVEKLTRELLDKKIIVHSCSPWASPIVLAPKKDGTLRFCIDFRAINKITIPDEYPLPHQEDLFNTLGKSVIFSKLDLVAGYWQVTMAKKDQPKTAFRTLYGHFEFTRMPFGLRNAPATFQRLIESMLRPYLYKIALAMIDDILIFSPTIHKHFESDLPKVLQRLRDFNLKAKVKKCEFAMQELEYLGHLVGHDQIKPLPGKIKAILEMPTPSNVSETRSLLGMVNYYHRFIPNLATLAHPINTLLQKNITFNWSDDCKTAWEEIKLILTSYPVMTIPNFTEPFFLTTDASYKGLGAILSQREGRREKIIAYASRSLNPAEKNYAVTELEALAVVWAVKRFKHYLTSTNFTVVTDHRPLKWLMTAKTENTRLIRWALELQSFSFDVEHKPGKLNVHADCLSRLPIDKVEQVNAISTTNLLQIKLKQRRDPQLQTIFNFIEKGEIPASKRDQNYLKLEHENYILERGLLYHLFHQLNPNKRNTTFAQLVIPKDLQDIVVQENHDSSISGHLAFFKTYHRIRRKYYWIGMYSAIKSYCEKCVQCAKRKKPNRIPIAPLQSMPPTDFPFQRVAVDYVCNLTKTSTGFSSILVFTDYHTRYVEICATRNQTAETTARAFIDLIVTRHSAPSQLLSDRGATFLSELVTTSCKVMKTKKIFTSAYHPQTDGLVERFNKTLGDMLAAFCRTNQRDWDQYLKVVAFAYNNSIQESTLETPFYLLYGRDPVTPLDLALGNQPDATDTTPQFLLKLRQAWNLAKQNTLHAQRKQRTLYNQRVKFNDYQIGDKVLLSDPVTVQGVTAKLSNRYKGPYRIMQQTSPVNFKLENVNGSPVTFNPIVHVNRLRPCPS